MGLDSEFRVFHETSNLCPNIVVPAPDQDMPVSDGHRDIEIEPIVHRLSAGATLNAVGQWVGNISLTAPTRRRHQAEVKEGFFPSSQAKDL